jgi:hypothetical protein
MMTCFAVADFWATSTFERILEAARRYAQGRISAIEWVRGLHDLEAKQRVSR